MVSFVVKNNAESTVADNPLAQAAVTLNVAGGEGANFPSTFPFLITIWDDVTYPDPTDDSGMEIVKCTGRAVDALTIVRAQEGTGDVAHTLAERVAMLITAGIFNDATYGVSTKIDTVETNADVTDAVNIASSIVGVGDKATPVNADSFGIVDSAAANVLKELTWTNIKATLKTYFDTLYDNKASAWLGAEGAYLPATNPAALVEVAGATTYGGWSYLAFDDTTSEHAIWRVPMPDYDGGNIVVTAFSKPATTPAGAVTLQFNILTIGLATSEAFNSAVTVDTTVNISHSMNTTELQTDVMVASATIDPANVVADDLMVIELSRDVASDNLTGDGQLVGVLIEYTRS